MATKSDFSAEEWTQLVEGPTTAGLIVLRSAGGGTFRETFALARAYTDARKQHGASQLLDELVAEKPAFDRHRYPSNEKLHDEGLQRLAETAQLLRAKGSPEDVAAYTDFVLGVATKVAAAHKEDGQEVSPPEQAALDEIRARLSSPG
jgi:hypothetical protein